MNVKRIVTLCAALLLAQGQARACEESELQPLLERFAAATAMPLTDCVREVAAVGGDAFWQNECRRIEESPDAAMLREHGRRMSIQFRELQSNEDGATAVIVNLHGPDILAFNEKLDRWKQCRTTADTGLGESGRSSAESCGPWTWDAIPVIDRYGAIPLTCNSGTWALIAPAAAAADPEVAPEAPDHRNK
ncbi:hypothetical protein LVB77_01135 [Lysobacter sp. 5GHs7-4]|uniref:hypothetical protein n=1 Tax=Lysobacter sp. 5GHs7-4 TaxID=2904253 RepID=UPI001E3B675D|nr:hypothetical protein [Lysobacter sp. 5GHs7-4]UHQ23348.1 hypothetical protein LVB77_01135 [Lysobacter sp. 5GHs7-4]